MPTDRNGSLLTNMTHKVVNQNRRTTVDAPYQTGELFHEVNQAGHPALGEESEQMSMTEITAGHALSSQSNAYNATNNDNGAHYSQNQLGQTTHEGDPDQNQRSHVQMQALPDGAQINRSVAKLNKSQVNVANIAQQVDSSSAGETPGKRVKSTLSRNNNFKTQ